MRRPLYLARITLLLDKAAERGEEGRAASHQNRVEENTTLGVLRQFD